MKKKQMTVDDISLTKQYVVIRESVEIGIFDDEEDAKHAIIKDIMLRNSFYTEPSKDQAYLLTPYRIAEVFVPTIM